MPKYTLMNLDDIKKYKDYLENGTPLTSPKPLNIAAISYFIRCFKSTNYNIYLTCGILNISEKKARMYIYNLKRAGIVLADPKWDKYNPQILPIPNKVKL